MIGLGSDDKFLEYVEEIQNVGAVMLAVFLSKPIWRKMFNYR